ncbi:hypothetical protein [Thalassobacillus devorans]|uniref:hypothetical protein n=1 Tax=Thalassobacillus devorans TaxID=279813 RepID=UPI000A1CE3E2|nr:hypothetical protein [Thalassobacillus devorans]
MPERMLTIEEFNELLKHWNGEKIKISKHELDDVDTTFLQLDSVSYRTKTRRMDEYQPMHTLSLNGQGEITLEAGGSQPLPDASYEIPLEDTTLYRYDDGTTFTLVTERGTYTIEIMGNNT